MKIVVAKTAGFCTGVQRAVEMALDAANTRDRPIYTYGPLIHNPQVLKLLQDKGIRVLETIPEKGTGVVIIRAHGVPPKDIQRLVLAGYSILDATCPKVIKVQKIIHKYAEDGNACIIVGDKDHPEVKGLLGYAGAHGFVIGGLHDLESLPAFEKAIVVAQTTQNTLVFGAVKKWAADYHPHYTVFDTICDSTERRQTEVKRLAESVDAVVVVGGETSGNTKRLAEIVRQTGRPAFHIESEADVDATALRDIRRIGITAGASTPNWVIKRIYRAIEAIPYRDDPSSWKRRLFHFQRLLLLTNLYIALGAGSLCYACAHLQDIERKLPYIIISVLYVLSMHILNNLTGMREARFNDPDRAVFYETHKAMLTLIALSSGAVGLSIAASMGVFPFVLLLIMSVLGLCYNLTLVPDRIKGVKYRKIRDIPGSKTVLIALAWGMVTVLFPIWAESNTIRLSTLPALVWSSAIVFVRTAFFDVLDMQGDRIVGKETIPILLGREKALSLLRTMIAIVFLTLFMTAALEIIPRLGFALLASPIYLYLVMVIQQRGVMTPGVRMEFIAETHFILVGGIAFLWAVWPGR